MANFAFFRDFCHFFAIKLIFKGANWQNCSIKSQKLDQCPKNFCVQKMIKFSESNFCYMFDEVFRAFKSICNNISTIRLHIDSNLSVNGEKWQTFLWRI